MNMDILRIMATIFVVMIHCTDGIILSPSLVSNNLWNIALVVEALVRCAVPIFLMLTGAFLLGKDKKEESPMDFYSRKLKRVVVVYITWSVFYTLAMAYLFGSSIPPEKVVNDFIGFSGGYHLWYFKPLITIYILLPFIRIAIKKVTKKQLILVTSILVLIETVIPSINKIFHLNIFTFNLSILHYIAYVLIGHMIYETAKSTKNNKTGLLVGGMVWIIGLVMSIVLVYQSKILYIENIDAYFYNPLAINIFLSSVGVFTFFSFIKISKTSKLIKNLSKYSFGVYLVHPIIESTLKLKYYNVVEMNSINGYFIITIFIIAISWVISILMNHTPILKDRV